MKNVRQITVLVPNGGDPTEEKCVSNPDAGDSYGENVIAVQLVM